MSAPGFSRIAVFGGVYSNHRALVRAIEDARERDAEAIFCLGDLGGFGPRPDRTPEILRDYSVRCLRGSHRGRERANHRSCP